MNRRTFIGVLGAAAAAKALPIPSHAKPAAVVQPEIYGKLYLGSDPDHLVFAETILSVEGLPHFLDRPIPIDVDVEKFRFYNFTIP